MITNTSDLLNHTQRLIDRNRDEQAALAAAYGWELPHNEPPDEAPSPAFQQARRITETRSDSRLTKYFAPPSQPVAASLPPTSILILSEQRMLALPEPLLGQVQACEKHAAGGRWYVSVPAALWHSLTRLLGEG